MNNSKAIVTLAIGESYLQQWRTFCERGWQTYGAKYGYDVICIDRPLDTSDRAKKRSPAWQKCLVLSQGFADRYERIVWIDVDILINGALAPCISREIPIDKVGAVDMTAGPTRQAFSQTVGRLHEFWGLPVAATFGAREYDTSYGLPSGFDEVVQTGVLVLSPKYHRALLERTYYQYEEKGGCEWHMEMRPLSYELLKAGMVHWLDSRFNVNWLEQRALYYPFLVNLHTRRAVGQRVRRTAVAVLKRLAFLRIERACATSAFLNSFFLHLGGASMSDMELIDGTALSWRDCSL